MAPNPTSDSGVESEIEFVDVAGEKSEPTSSSKLAERNVKGEPLPSEDANNQDHLEETSTGEKKRFLTLDDNGDKYVFPWEMCKTWKAMEELLNDLPGFKDKRDAIANGDIQLKSPDGKIIVPAVWEYLVEPDIELKIRPLNDFDDSTSVMSSDSSASTSSSDSSPPRRRMRRKNKAVEKEDESEEEEGEEESEESDSSEQKEVSYTPAISYKVDFWEGKRGQPNYYLDTKSTSKRIVFKHVGETADKDMPVLEETRKVLRQKATAHYRKLPPPPPPPGLPLGPPMPPPFHPVKVSKKIFRKRFPLPPLPPPPLPFPNNDMKKWSSNKLEPGDKIMDPMVTIHSTLLMNALKSVMRYTTQNSRNMVHNLDDAGDNVFKYPYMDLYHNKDALIKYKTTPSEIRDRHTPEYNAETDTHIDVLVDYLYAQPDIDLAKAEQRWSNSTPTVTFGNIWLLLKPGEDVFVREDGALNAYVIEAVNGGVISKDNVTDCNISLWNLNYNGVSIGRSHKTITVPVFDGECAIVSLPVFPTRFHVDPEGTLPLRQRLINRGKKYFELSKGPAYMEYTGVGVRDRARRYKKARVVIDHSQRPWEILGARAPHRNMNAVPAPNNSPNGFYVPPSPPPMDETRGTARRPGCECHVCQEAEALSQVYQPITFSDYDGIIPKKVDSLTDHQYLICAPSMYGFVLKDRFYDFLDVERIVPPTINENAMDMLVLNPPTLKESIKAICETYTSPNGREEHFCADFIQGKGEGQIFLLHGPPGTGKTLTAECVAEYTRRPLLAITAADLGHEADALEKNLLGFFRDALNWDAIVLLDEADVYLAKRSQHDLARNCVVSIFLRALDYFQGILFLTSNRIGDFDEAFKSRIHMTLGYDALSDPTRHTIWDNNFRKLVEVSQMVAENQRRGREDGEIVLSKELRYDFDAKTYVKSSADVRDLSWNGREIRNAFQTAVALAMYEAKLKNKKEVVLGERHIRQVVEMSTAFKEYMDLGDL